MARGSVARGSGKRQEAHTCSDRITRMLKGPTMPGQDTKQKLRTETSLTLIFGV